MVGLTQHPIPFIYPCILTPASTEKVGFSKKTETQSKTEWPKNNPTWRISRIIKFWLFIYCFCFILLFCLYFGFLVCFFCLLCFCFYKTLQSLCCSTHNPCIQKNHKRILTAIFGSREKNSETCMKDGGPGSPFLRKHVWVRYD